MNRKYTLHLLPILGFLITLIYSKQIPGLSIYPSNKKGFHTYSDATYNGNSSVLMIPAKDSISFKMRIESGHKEPYAGFTYNFPSGNRLSKKLHKNYFDLSSYDRITLKLNSSNIKFIKFSINTLEKGISDTLDPVSYRHNTIEVPLLKDKTEYQIKIKDCRTPQWWYKNYNVAENELNSPDWSISYNLNFLSHFSTNKKTSIITVKEISLHKNYNNYLYFLFSLCLLYYSYILWLFFSKKNNKKQKEIIVTYIQRDLKEDPDIKNASVIEYIAENYHNPNLLISDIANTFNIKQQTASKLITETLGINFKSYLNNLRLKEAKRLLSETKITISEIAYEVGFNSPNNFNRVFKNYEKCSPSEYRRRINSKKLIHKS